MKTFLDNVANFAIEQCLVDDVAGIISPAKVWSMDIETLSALASESAVAQSYRKNLLNREKNLKQALAICNQRARSGESVLSNL
jgi:hypothetical protein